MVFHLDKDGFDIEFHDFFNVFLCKFFISLDDDLCTFHGDNFTGVFVDEVFGP